MRLVGADQRGANLSGYRDGNGGAPPITVFIDATCDKWTRWPATLDPVAAGAVLAAEAK